MTNNNMSYKNDFSLTFTQCKQLVENGYDLRDFLEQVVDNQPSFIASMGAINSIYELQAIQQGGCSSGAYMPAVTYSIAKTCMSEHGDDVLAFIENHLEEIPKPPNGATWGGVCVFYLSMAVELWTLQFNLKNVNWD